jgi:hypothetical protein
LHIYYLDAALYPVKPLSLTLNILKDSYPIIYGGSVLKPF